MKRTLLLTVSFVSLVLFSCNDRGPQAKKVREEPFVYHKPDRLEDDIRDNIEELVDLMGEESETKLPFRNPDVLLSIYAQNQFHRIWARDSSWYERADSFYTLIQQAEHYGLFPEEYHYNRLRMLSDSLKRDGNRKHAGWWSMADLLMSDAFISFAHDLHLGRIPRDSMTLNPDSTATVDFYFDLFAQVVDSLPRGILEKLEPHHPGYQSLRRALPAFVAKMDRRKRTYISFPKKDSMTFIRQLQQRLFEENCISDIDRLPDSMELNLAVRKAQSLLGLTVDGKAGPQVIRRLNETGLEQFRRIAMNLDRYKQLPDSMPVSYILVNLPAFRLDLYDSGKVVLQSKVIIGQPKTRTPLLTSRISNLVTFPQWTVPYSIVFKEMLPKIKEDISYLQKQNLMVVDRYDSVIDPYTIDWKKLSRNHFPYLLRQRQGDDNSLGVMKFNFANKYAVYLHDTNARSLFARANRALSHGCVRVQAWDSLSRFLVARDSANVSVDTMEAWLSRQEKHQIPLRRKIPVYFRYISSEVGEDGGIAFYEDIYGEDNQLRIRYLY